MKDYTIWLEFEHVDYSDSDMENELANVIIDFTDGRHADLLKTDSLEKMLNPSVLSASETSDDE